MKGTSTPPLHLVLSALSICALALPAACQVAPNVDVTQTCEDDGDCRDEDDGGVQTHCGTAEAETYCCEPGTEKCACGEDDACADDLVCYDQTLAGYPEGRFCNIPGLELGPGFEVVD